MAEDGEKVGGIYVDVDANMQPFDTAMAKFDKAVTDRATKSIKLQLNLAKDFSAKEKMVEVTAKWAAGTLTGLAEKLAARNYAVTIGKLKVSQDAYTTLRQSLDSLFANYTGVVNVTAKISGIDASTGNSINLNQNLLNQSDVASAASASTTRSSTGRPQGQRAAEPVVPVATSRSTTSTRRTKAEIAAAKAEASTREAAIQELQQILDKEEAAKQRRSSDFSARPRYSTPLINEARRLSSVQTAGYHPEWLRLMNARDKGPRAGGPIPREVEASMRARISELKDRRTRTKTMESELQTLEHFIAPYEAGVRNPQEMLAFRMQQEGGPGSIWRNAGAGGTPQGDRMNRMPTTEDTPSIKMVGKVGKHEMTQWGYQRNRNALLALRAVDPNFKPRANEDYYAAMDRAKRSAAQPATMGEGVTWNGEIGDIYSGIAATDGHHAARKFAVDAKNAIRSRYKPRDFNRKDRVARSLINDAKTSRLTDEEREALGAVVLNDQDTADILTLNQLIGGESQAHIAQSRSGMVPKRSSQSVRPMGFETEDAQAFHDMQEAARRRGKTKRGARSAVTRATKRWYAAHPEIPKGFFDTAPDALKGFKSGELVVNEGPALQEGMEMARMGWAQTPEGQNEAFQRGMHKTKTGQMWWNKTDTLPTRRAKAEDVAEYQRIVAEHAAFAASRAGSIVGAATRPSELSGVPTSQPASASYSQTGVWRLTAGGRPQQQLPNGKWQFGKKDDYNAWASANGAPASGTRTSPEPTQIPLAGPEPVRAMAAEPVVPIGGGSSTGGGGGGTVSLSGPIDVNVLNFQDLVGMLPRGIAEGQQAVQGTPEEVAKALGFSSMDDFRAALTGHAPLPAGGGGDDAPPEGVMFGPPHPGDSLKRTRLDPRAREVWPKLGRTPRVTVSPEQRAQEKAAATEADSHFKGFSQKAKDAEKQQAAVDRQQRQYDAYLTRQAGVHSRAAAAQEKREVKEDDRNERAYAKEQARLAKSAAAAAARPGPTAVDAATATYFRREGLGQYTPPRAIARPSTRDPYEIARQRAEASNTAAEFPERAPSIAVGQLFSRALGFKARYQEEQQILGQLRGQLTTTTSMAAREQEQTTVAKQSLRTVSENNVAKMRAGTLTDEDKRKQTQLLGVYKEHKSALKDITDSMNDQSDVVDKQAEKVKERAGAFEKIASIGALFVGAKAFTIGLAAASAGLGMVEKAGAKAVDQMMGFGATSTRVTNQLGEQTKALHGNTEAVYGAAAMSAGLSNQAAAFLKNGTIATAQAKAGSAAQGETSDLLRANIGAGSSPKGLYSGYGGLFNSAFLGSEMGGGKGYVEQVLGDIKGFTQMQGVQRGVQTPGWGTNPVRGVQNPVSGVQLKPGDIAQSIARPDEVIAPEMTGLTAQATKAKDSRDVLIKDQNAAYERNYKYLGKASEGLMLVYDSSKETASAMGELAGQLTGDAKTAAEDMAKAHVAIKDSSGNVIKTAADFQNYWQNAAAGKSRPEASSVYQQQGWQLRAQLQSQRAASLYQQENKIPGNWGLQLGINPMAQVTGTGTAFSQMARGTSAGARASAMGIAGQAQTGRDAIQAQADQYLQSMVANAQTQLNSGGNYTGAQDLQTNLNSVLQLGMQIRDVTKQISFLGAAQQAKEYANSLRLAQRAKEDALGLAGRGGSEMGAIQRQQFMLGRQSTALSLAMSQRQINFQVASAGFQAPGGTSEARAANIKEAKLEAAYAQKQLDIQKKQFALAGKEFGISTARAVTDALKSIGLLKSGRDTSLQIAAYTAKLENLQTSQQLSVAKLNEGLTTADNIFQTKLGMAAEAAGTLGISLGEAAKELDKWMEANGFGKQPGSDKPTVTYGPYGSHTTTPAGSGGARTGGAIGAATAKLMASTKAAVKDTTAQLGKVNSAQAKAAAGMAAATAANAKAISTYVNTLIAYWGRFFAAVTASSNAYQAQMGGGGGNGGQRDPKQYNASGFIGTVSGATNMIMGEAGDETVAILRNPRSVSATGSGGGGTSIVIQINNPSVRNDGDITAIAREVEKVMNRKASLIGMRSIS